MIERILERGLFASRWLMAPFYVGLVLALAGLLVKFVQETIHFVLTIASAKESDVVLGVLTLIDLSLAGNLLLIVVFSGYENFVSKINTDENEDRPSWMGHVGFSDLKMKLIGSIVAISGIELLKAFMHVESYSTEQLAWKVGIHMTFVISGVLYAVMDRLGSKDH